MNGAHSKMVEGTIAKISWRILPLAAVTYCVAYIDRTNVSFAMFNRISGCPGLMVEDEPCHFLRLRLA
jgi:hypothetical protein